MFVAVVGQAKNPVGAAVPAKSMIVPAGTLLANTNSVVATCVVFVPADAVGAAGVPVNVGAAIGASPVVYSGTPLAF